VGALKDHRLGPIRSSSSKYEEAHEKNVVEKGEGLFRKKPILSCMEQSLGEGEDHNKGGVKKSKVSG